jgi:hypothetical protein
MSADLRKHCFCVLVLGVVVLRGGLVGSALAANNGGSGTIGPNGHVGRLQIDRSTVQNVIAFAGAPSAVGSGAVTPPFAPYEALGYSCQTRPARDLSFTGTTGSWCRTVFYINQHTHKLAAFFSSTDRYRGPDGIHPGMSNGTAAHRVHKRAVEGCRSGFALGSSRTTAELWVDVDGGRVDERRGDLIVGGRIGSLALESSRHPIGLLFC